MLPDDGWGKREQNNGDILTSERKGHPAASGPKRPGRLQKSRPVRSGRTARGLGDPFHLSHLDEWPRSGETRRDTAAPRRSAYLAANGWGAIVAGYLTAGRGLVTANGHACLLWRNSAEQLPEVPGQPSVREVIGQLVGSERLPEVMRALAAFGAIRPEQPYLYVHVVAARPGHQGERLGTRLLEAVDATDPGRQVTYLESTNPRNHPFYARNGFKAGPGITLPGNAVVATPFTRRRTGATD